MKKNSKSLIIYNLNYTVYGEYPSITEASKSLNCNDKTIRTFAFDCKSKGGFKN
jgi:NUMOD1 domain